jgi:hypothetical protein
MVEGSKGFLFVVDNYFELSFDIAELYKQNKNNNEVQISNIYILFSITFSSSLLYVLDIVTLSLYYCFPRKLKYDYFQTTAWVV